MRDQPKWEGKQACPACGRVTYSFLHSCPGVPQRPPRHSGHSESDGEAYAAEHVNDDYRAAFYRVLERCEELKTSIAGHQWNALEMSRKADLAERRAEEAEFHVEQLRDARDAAERRIERACEVLDGWEHDGPKGYEFHLLILRVREALDGAVRACRRCECGVDGDGQCPCGCGDPDECVHEWLDRPESDTRECLICGTEVAG